MYLANIKSRSLTMEGKNVEFIAAAQVLGITIYIYHKWGKECKWLKFPCISEAARLHTLTSTMEMGNVVM